MPVHLPTPRVTTQTRNVKLVCDIGSRQRSGTHKADKDHVPGAIGHGFVDRQR
jgi:hypothetical protein